MLSGMVSRVGVLVLMPPLYGTSPLHATCISMGFHVLLSRGHWCHEPEDTGVTNQRTLVSSQ
nr:MAG TPA: hypothetical protein [Caudoviricetes sp.]